MNTKNVAIETSILFCSFMVSPLVFLKCPDGTVIYYGWPALLADSECFSAVAALAVFCSNFVGRICISDFRPSTQIVPRKSTLPYLLKVTVRRERRWTTAGATPARELVRSTR